MYKFVYIHEIKMRKDYVMGIKKLQSSVHKTFTKDKVFRKKLEGAIGFLSLIPWIVIYPRKAVCSF